MGPEGTSRADNNGGFDFDKCCRYIDWIKPILGTSLENRIYSGLEELVCTPNPPNANRLSCVNRCLDVATEWVDYLDACCAKNTNARDAMIKNAIEYLVKDGLVTHFVDPDVPNNRENRIVCRKPDSSATEQNVWKSMNVWRFINEKDYWLCQDCTNISPICTNFEPSPIINLETFEHTSSNRNSDLEVEVGSRTNETPAPGNVQGKHSNRYSFSNQTIANANSSKPPVCQRHSSAFNETEVRPRTDCLTKSRATMTCNCTRAEVPRKSSKLKLVVHKTTNTSRSTIPNPPKATNLSIPCKPSHLIVRIFEADPSLSDSCLVLMRRKFENSVRNVCSCLNDVLGKLEDAMIRELRLGCKIRSGRIDLNLQHRGSSKDRLFLARLPTCRSVHKRVTRLGTVDDRGSLQTLNGNVRPPKDSEVYVEGCNDATRIKETDGTKMKPCLPASPSIYKCVSRFGSMDDHGTLQTLNGDVHPPRDSEVYVDGCNDEMRIKETDDTNKKPCLSTSRSFHKRVTRFGTMDDHGSLQTPSENVRPPKDSEVSVNDCYNDALKKNNEADGKKKCVTFYSPCSNNDSTEENEIGGSENHQIRIEEHHGRKMAEKEIDFVWTRNMTKGLDQSSTYFSRVHGFEKSESSDVDSEIESIRSNTRTRNFGQMLLLRENKEPSVSKELCQVDTKLNDISEDQPVANTEEKTSSESDCDCCSGSLQENPCKLVSQETDSPIEVCSPEQCLCHVFCVDDNADTCKREANDEHGAREEVDNFEGNRAETVHHCRSVENESKTKRTASRTEEDVSRTRVSFLRSSSSVARAEGNVLDGEKGISRLETNNPAETNDIHRIKKDTCAAKENISETKSGSERTEKFSVDCISDTKCSCCGKDLSDSEATDAELVDSVDTRFEENNKNLEVSKISNSRTEETKEDSTTRQPSKCKASSVVDADEVSSLRDRSSGRFALTEFSRKRPEISGQSLVDDDDDRRAVSATRVNTKQFARRSNASTDRESFSEDLCTYMYVVDTEPVTFFEPNFFFSNDFPPFQGFSRRTWKSKKGLCQEWMDRGRRIETCRMSRETHERPRLGKSRRSRRFATRPSSRSANNLRRIDTKTKEHTVPDRRAKEGNNLAAFSRYKRRFWRGSIVPGNLCASFPAASIDRIKHLIRKKLRRLLLEERDKGTSTSKTFLKNDRYFVSISSGKLNEGRTTRASCNRPIASSFCPTRNRTAIGEPEATCRENSFENGRNYTLNDVEKQRRRIFKKVEVSKVPKLLNRERDSIDKRKLINQRHESMETDVGTRTRDSYCDYAGSGRRSSVASLVSTRVLFLKHDAEQCSGDVREKQPNGVELGKLLDERARNSKGEKFETHFHGDFRSVRASRRSGRSRCGCEFFARDENRNRNVFHRVILEGVESRSRSQDSRSFGNPSFDYLGNSDKDFSRVFGDYERCMNNLGADFRSKLLQYVALCKSVKDSLINRLRSDDVYEVSPRAPCSEDRFAMDDVHR